MSEPRTGFAFLDIRDPLVAWLVYRGEMVSASAADANALSFWTASYLADLTDERRAKRFEKELALDRLRQHQYPQAVSRLAGFYVFPDIDAATNAARQWGGSFREELLAEVGLRHDARFSCHDAEWISHELDSQSHEWMPRYLAGEPYGDSPIWELVVDGRALVFGTTLRMAAYETVKATWPRSLALLELARQAVELDSDLGLTVGALFDIGGQRTLRYIMHFADAKNPAFLERLAAFEGPKNAKDVPPDFELVLPDLRDREFHV